MYSYLKTVEIREPLQTSGYMQVGLSYYLADCVYIDEGYCAPKSYVEKKIPCAVVSFSTSEQCMTMSRFMVQHFSSVYLLCTLRPHGGFSHEFSTMFHRLCTIVSYGWI
jgi:hypothetical protein